MLSGFNLPESRMNVGKTLFAQVMEFVPWKTFARFIERHKGDVGVRTLGCADLFRIMAFSQLTWRESLRDIEVCLEAERTRKKLRNFASALAGEYSDEAYCFVKQSGDDAAQGQANRQNRSDQKEQSEEAESESVGNPASYWA